APSGASYVVVLNSDFIGNGSEELGRTLMKSFLFSLTEQDVLPDKVLCYNAGALLTTEGSAVLDDLKALEEDGVEVLTCGICGEFYGVKDKLAVGTFTNMYRIVEILRTAKTVSP
ncbi:MAG: sulfurtransferase-like selenium metabolism protein YedF, partial [Clostridia bacterium]|nr:sulfurtransferase-like selenium metabolism protein YedF [Clostridia bacterium]